MFSDKNNKNTLILSSALSGTVIMELALLALSGSLQMTEFVKCLLVMLVMIFCIIYFVVSNAENYYKDKAFVFIVAGIFLVYMTLTSFPNDLLQEAAFYLTGGVLLSLLTDYHLGMLLNFTLMLYSSVLNREFSYEILFNFVISLLLCMLIKNLKNYISLVFICIITLALQVTAALLRSNFDLEKVLSLEMLGILTITLLFVAAAFIILRLIKDFCTDTSNVFTEVCDTENISTENEEIAVTLEPVEAAPKTEDAPVEDYKKYLSDAFELYALMKNKFSKTFTHSKCVAELAGNIAGVMNANSDLCYAGGLYHEIEKLDAEDTIIKQYGLPEEITAIIKEHNYKNELPTSMESVIVMISDSIVTTYEFMLRSEKEIVTSKLVDNTFQMHFNKGTVEKAGISIKDFSKLKQAFQTEMVFFKFEGE